MIYQATHLVNFAQGEMAMFTTYLSVESHQRRHAVLGGILHHHRARLPALGALIERIVIRPVENAPVLAVVVVFIALLVILNSIAGWIYTYTIKAFLSPSPKEPLFGIRYMSAHELGAIGITLVVLKKPRSTFSSATRPSAWRCAPWRRTCSRAPFRRHPRRLDARARLGTRRLWSARWRA